MGNWVSVSEKLPSTKEYVLVTYVSAKGSRHVGAANFVGDRFLTVGDDEEAYHLVIAWQPMPAAYGTGA
jgi:hypothetical protein